VEERARTEQTANQAITPVESATSRPVRGQRADRAPTLNDRGSTATSAAPINAHTISGRRTRAIGARLRASRDRRARRHGEADGEVTTASPGAVGAGAAAAPR
jgi:hypothetical protein